MQQASHFVPCAPRLFRPVPACHTRRVPAGTRTHRRAPCGRRSRLRPFRVGAEDASRAREARARSPASRSTTPRPWASRRSSTSGTSPTRGALVPGRVFRTATPAGRIRRRDGARTPRRARPPRPAKRRRVRTRRDWSRMFEMCRSTRRRRRRVLHRMVPSRRRGRRRATTRALSRASVGLRPILRRDFPAHEYVGEGEGGCVHRAGEARGPDQPASTIRGESQRRRSVPPQRGDARLERTGDSRGAPGDVDRHGGCAVGVLLQGWEGSTGYVAALALHCCGVSEDDIVADYHRSDAAGSSALGGGKIERGLSIDYSRFRGAPKEVMEHALEHARRKHGSVDGYLDSIGFDSDARYRLARALCS